MVKNEINQIRKRYAPKVKQQLIEIEYEAYEDRILLAHIRLSERKGIDEYKPKWLK